MPLRTLLVSGSLALGAAAVVASPLLAPATSGAHHAAAYSGGAPAGFSGPEQNCAACHDTFGDADTGTGSVSIDAPGAFSAGTPVPITVSLDNTTPAAPARKQGFEVSVRDAQDPSVYVGAFDLGGSDQVRLAQGDARFVTHTRAGSEASSWSFAWVPPADAPAEVIVYLSGNAANGDGGSEGDYVYTASRSLARSVAAEAGAELAPTRLEAPAPHPAVARTALALVLDRPGRVRVRLLDGLGRELRTLADEARPAGPGEVAVETLGLAPGTYFVVAETPDGTRTQPLVVAR